MSCCAVIKCRYKFKNNDHIIFHRFPDNPTLLKRWIIALKDEELRKNEELFLCPDHIKLIEHNGSTSLMDSDEFSLMENKPKIESVTLDVIDYDLKKTCRMCLFSNNVSNQQMIKIFESGSSKISIDGELKLLKFKVSPNDGLPQQICSDCMNCLININKFRVIGVESQKILEHYFKHSLVNVLPPQQQQQQQLMTDEIIWIKTEMDDVDKLDQLPLNEKPYDDYNDYSDLLQTYDSDNEMGIQHDYKKTDIVINLEKHSKSKDLKGCNMNDIKGLCKFCLKHPINIELGDYQQQPTDECKLDTINEIKCLHCDLNCMNIDDYVKHTNAIHPGLLCWICKEFCLDKKDLTVHLTSQHASDELKCNVCFAVFKNYRCLKSHKHYTHSTTENICQICFLKFDNKYKLKYHTNYHHRLASEKKFSCNSCDKSFLYNHHLKNHEKMHEKPYRYKCRICGQGFANVIEYSDHIKYLHKDEFNMFKCDYCDKEYVSKSSLRKHIHCNHKNECSSIIHCDECNSSFTTRDGYEIHKKAHTNSAIHKYICDICEHTFTSCHLVRRHILGQHSTNSNRSSLRNTKKIKKQNTNVKPNNKIDLIVRRSKWLCKFCGKHYVNGNKADYQRPNAKCNLEKEPNCRNCVEQFNNIDDYVKHVNAIHSVGFICGICNVNCFEKSTLTTHLATHTAEECDIKCDECNRSFKTRNNLLFHKKRMHVVSDHVCHICTLKFDNYMKFKSHMKGHTRIKHKCSHCDKTFNHRYRLTQHERIHSGELTHLCNICGLAFISTSSLSTHMKKHIDLSLNSTQSEKKIYQCKFCDKAYTNKSSWYHHQHYYHPKGIAAKIFRCDKCDRNFITMKAFEYHLNSHDDAERKHKCVECPLAFKRNAHLQNHVLSVHLKEKPYKCLFCDKAFVQNGDLNIHMRVHNGEKPHRCKYCNESFRLRIDKNTHERTHTGEKPYKCTRCDMSYINNRQLRIHFRKHIRNHEMV